MVANVSTVAFLLISVFFFVYFSASYFTSRLFLSSSPSFSSYSSSLFVMESAKILRSSSVEVSPLIIDASVKKWWEEDGVAWRPVTLLLGPRKVAVGGTEEYLMDWEADLVTIHSEVNVDVDLKNRR